VVHRPQDDGDVEPSGSADGGAIFHPVRRPDPMRPTPATDRPHRAGAVLYTISSLLLLAGLFMMSGIVVALIYGERREMVAFAAAAGVALLCSVSGFLSFRPFRDATLLTRDGFLVVVLSWLVVCTFGALPYVISGAIPSYTDAFFETMSGFTTTGATLLGDLEAMPRSILFWRSLTQWLGGMGIVVLTVAILPRLGIGGLKLMRSEAPGPTLEKLTPRVAGTAKILWLIYLGLTVMEAVLLLAAGLPLFDALTHTFSTIATGGFSPRTESVGAYESPFVHVVVTVFMLLAAVNFSLYYQAIRGRPGKLLGNLELRTFIGIYVLAALVLTLAVTGPVYQSLGQGVRFAAFQAASLLTGTGFTTANYDAWPNLARAVLLVIMFIGGCSGSTAGGIKVIRVATLFRQALNEFKFLIHPQGIFTLRVGDRRVKKDIMYPVAMFFFLYIGLILLTTLIVAGASGDLTTAITTGLATVGNVGPGFGAIGPAQNYAFYPDAVKWWLSFAMLTGRLEVYSVLVLLTPAFWRR
jgi:trk system potassium uptake protein TrkH